MSAQSHVDSCLTISGSSVRKKIRNSTQFLFPDCHTRPSLLQCDGQRVESGAGFRGLDVVIYYWF